MLNSVATDIKDRLDIVEYVGRFVPDLKKQGNLFKACCPFHNEKTPSFVVNPTSQTWRCFGSCAEGGDIFNFAMKKHGWTFSEAVQELGRLAGVDTSPKRNPEQRQQDEQRQRVRGILQHATEEYHNYLLSGKPEVAETLRYVQEKRGFRLETLRQFQIGYAPPGWSNMLDALSPLYSAEDLQESGLVSRNDAGRVYDRFRNRLMIPICDERGHVIGFGARALDPNDNPKYLNSPQSLLFDKSKTLFGLNHAKTAIRESGVAVIVEGYMDAIQAHQAGYPNVVAQMGTAMTEAQLSLIAPRYAHKVILALDADAAGQNATRRSLEVARQTLQTDMNGRMSADMRVLQIENAKDPDDILRETPALWQGYVDAALPVADFVIGMELAQMSPNASSQERQALAWRLLPILTASENNIYNHENIQKLALKLRFDERDVIAWADQVRAQAKPVPVVPAASKAAAVPAVARPEPPAQPLTDSDAGTPEPPDFFLEEYAVTAEPEEAWMPVESGGTPAPAEPDLIVRRRAPDLPALTSRHQSRAAEETCLRLLIRNFDFYYEIERRFREIVRQGAAQSLKLEALSAEDFGETDLRLLVGLLVAAHNQFDETPTHYIERHLDAPLWDVWQALLQDEDASIHKHIGGRMPSEMQDILKQQARTPMTDRERLQAEMRRVLEVRDKRLRRELIELNFLIGDARDLGAGVQRMLVGRVQEILSAQRLFQQSLAELR